MNARKKKDDKATLGFWRENAEALTFAVIMALVVKQFAFEAYNVPTQSMEPTIIGRDVGGARLIANKFTYMLKDPERFDVVIFQYPLNRLLNYVKRCVGVGPEWLFVRGGDLYRADYDLDRAAALAAAEVVRKPLEIQEILFDQGSCIPPAERAIDSFRRHWKPVDPVAGGSLRLNEEEGLVTADGRTSPVLQRFVTEVPDYLIAGIENAKPEDYAVNNRRNDDWSQRGEDRGIFSRFLGLPSASESPERSRNFVPVGDMRLELSVRPTAAAGTVRLEIRDWSHPEAIVLELPVAGAGARGALTIGADRVEIGTQLPVGDWTELALLNYDDHVVVKVDGDVVLERDYSHAIPPAQAPTLNDSQVYPFPEERLPSEGELRHGENTALWGIAGGAADFRDFDLARDIHYLESSTEIKIGDSGDPRRDYASVPQATDFHIPARHYLMLGDNSPDSLDGRAWMRSELRYRNDDGELVVYEGDSQAVSDAPTRPNINPYVDAESGETRFLDVFGNTRVLDPARIEKVGFVDAEGKPAETQARVRFGNLVSRDFVQGRAYFVFFPILQIGIIR
ncbi:MAG: signal peptidase I [Planctomycetes bacterium]|nr:signal peptidase I [Planctomycetota bacterium]